MCHNESDPLDWCTVVQHHYLLVCVVLECDELAVNVNLAKLQAAAAVAVAVPG